MYLLSIEKKKVGGLTGKHHIRGIYEQENFLMTWYINFRFKIRWATKTSPIGSLLSPEPDAYPGVAKTNYTMPKNLQHCCEDWCIIAQRREQNRNSSSEIEKFRWEDLEKFSSVRIFFCLEKNLSIEDTCR